MEETYCIQYLVNDVNSAPVGQWIREDQGFLKVLSDSLRAVAGVGEYSRDMPWTGTRDPAHSSKDTNANIYSVLVLAEEAPALMEVAPNAIVGRTEEDRSPTGRGYSASDPYDLLARFQVRSSNFLDGLSF